MHSGKVCDPLSVVMLWSDSSSICDGALLREGLFVELRPQAGPLYPDSRLQWRTHEVTHTQTYAHTHVAMSTHLWGGKNALIHTLL